MRLINQAKGTVLAENVLLADSPFKRIKGLLGRAGFNQGQALIIKPGNSIHTFFMRFPIDILFVDKNNRVLKAVAHLPPFRLSPVSFRSSFVIELPAGTIRSTSTSQGDKLILE